jgi:hypothetical protein
VTGRGGWHLGHTLARGHGGASHVVDTIEDWRYTCLGHGGTHMRHDTHDGLVVWVCATDDGFC